MLWYVWCRKQSMLPKHATIAFAVYILILLQAVMAAAARVQRWPAWRIVPDSPCCVMARLRLFSVLCDAMAALVLRVA